MLLQSVIWQRVLEAELEVKVGEDATPAWQQLTEQKRRRVVGKLQRLLPCRKVRLMMGLTLIDPRIGNLKGYSHPVVRNVPFLQYDSIMHKIWNARTLGI